MNHNDQFLGVLFIFLSTKIDERNNHDPKSFETRFVCLPCQPMPPFIEIGFSITGAVSTKYLKLQSSNFEISIERLFNFFNYFMIIRIS